MDLLSVFDVAIVTDVVSRISPDMALSVLLICTLGGVAGFLAGLFGIGGGLVLVPGLYYTLSHYGYDAHAMHIAVGTSLSTIILTGSSSALAHHRKGALDFDLLRLLVPGVIFGVIIGASIASVVSVDGLKAFFALSQLLMGGYMLIRQDRSAIVDQMPRPIISRFIESLIAVIATLKGVGGGVQNVLFMTFCNVPMHRAVATASAIGVFIATAGMLSYITIGWNETGLPPYSIGYVNIIGLICIASVSIFTAPLGAKTAHHLPVKKLKKYFSVFMLLIAAKMLSEVFL